MANPMPPIPFKSPMTDQNGYMTISWIGFFRELFNRIGGTQSSSNATLETQVATLQQQVADLQKQVYMGRNL